MAWAKTRTVARALLGLSEDILRQHDAMIQAEEDAKPKPPLVVRVLQNVGMFALVWFVAPGAVSP